MAMEVTPLARSQDDARRVLPIKQDRIEDLWVVVRVRRALEPLSVAAREICGRV
jgi:hypothetical protein